EGRDAWPGLRQPTKALALVAAGRGAYLCAHAAAVLLNVNLPSAEMIDWREGAALPPGRPRTLPDLFAAARRDAGGATLIVDGVRSAGWEQLERWSTNLAGALAGALAPGERLAILAPNGLPHLVAEMAAWRLGAIAAPIFTGCGPARLKTMIDLAAPSVALVADPAHATAMPPGCRVIDVAALWRLADGDARANDRAVGPDTACLLLFTSGSTGAPRAVELTHDNLASQQAAFAALWPEVGPGDRLAAYLPWHHSFGALAERLWALVRGATLTVVPGGGRDRAALIDTVRAVAPTVFMSVPKAHRVVIEADAFAPGALRWAFTAGAPLDADLLAWYDARRIPLYEGWGLTETSPSATITPPGTRRVLGVVGQPIPGVAVGVRRDDGRIFVRGPNVMRGYFRDAPATALCLAGGTMDSGDLGAWTPEGLKLAGRADHLVKLPNGEKVALSEIEAALARHAAVRHAVVGIDDGALIALIEAAPGHDLGALARALAEVNDAQALHYCRVGAGFAVAEPLSVEGGGLTPSLKVARGAVLSAFRAWRRHGGAAFVDLTTR
ncbi:MAG TPA: AMP-binding protein, partial [Planctomycetota bacterium]|nr:AMP-binding protein [Planctomycetota bacterium]